MRRNGFTLIDVVVSLGVIVLVMTIISGVLMNTFKVNTTVNITDVVERNGTFALMEIRRNIINSMKDGMVCPTDVGTSLTLTGNNGELTRITCSEDGAIASASAEGAVVVDLTDDDVRVTGCGGFVSCGTAPSTEISEVNISFGLEAGVIGSGMGGYASRDFESSVTVRD